MFKNLGNIANLVKSIGQLPDRMSRLKQQMESKRICGRACEGYHQVRVEVRVLGLVHEVDISSTLLAPEHKSLVQRLTLEAINHAVVQAKAMHVEAIKEATHGVEFPGLEKIIEEIAK
jgi:DNA-binding protein YbaB